MTSSIHHAQNPEMMSVESLCLKNRQLTSTHLLPLRAMGENSDYLVIVAEMPADAFFD